MKIKKIPYPKYETDDDKKYICVNCDYIIENEPVYILTVGNVYKQHNGLDYNDLSARRFAVTEHRGEKETVQFVLCETAFNRLIASGSELILRPNGMKRTEEAVEKLATHLWEQMDDSTRKDIVLDTIKERVPRDEDEFHSIYTETFGVDYEVDV